MASDWPPSNRTATQVSIAVGYGLALAVLGLRLFGGGSLLFVAELLGAISLAAAVAVPPTLALLALRGRSLLLVPAALTSIAALFLYPLLGFPMALLGAIWLWTYSRIEDQQRGRPLLALGATLVAVVIWLAAAVVLFVHVDPRCAEQLSDGTVRMTDPAVQGLVTGWVWDVPSTTSGSATFSGDVVAAECTSDVVVWWEAAVSLMLSSGSVALAVVMVDRVAAPLAEN